MRVAGRWGRLRTEMGSGGLVGWQLVALLAALWGCASSKNVAGDSDPARSVWLNVCRSDADCGQDLICSCGVCSVRCSRDDECTRFAPAAACAHSIPLTSLCDVFEGGSVCEIACKSTSDCSALGPRAVCSAEWCRRAAPDSESLDCASRSAQIEAELEDTLDAAGRRCEVDRDCRRITLSNDCYGDGCSGIYVSEAGARDIAAKLADLQDRYCADAFEAGCVGPGLRSCPLQRLARCIDGMCEAER